MADQLTPFDIPKVEEKYKALFIGEFPVKLMSGGWGPAGAVFYQPNPDITKGHKKLFGLYFSRDTATIYDASYLEGVLFTGVALDDDTFVWSRDRHDYREVHGGAIDGGFDYLRVLGSPKTVRLQIKEGKVIRAENT
jgi:hypothetical protein